MTSARREVPTVFVRGHADAAEVRAVEEALGAALSALGADAGLAYSVLWIEADAPHEFAVEIELGLPGDTVGARAVAVSVRDAGDACITQVMDRVQRARATRE